ncbi:MAG TPA: hypothetical protein VJ911_10445 [Cryomorphaceae bacterium]|nr:hypothetical protein [Cryomorphaceae bacterium]
MNKIISNITLDLFQSKAILIYGILLAVLGWGLFVLESQPEKVILAILQINLVVLPLITSVFATIYFYKSSEFIQLLLIQPIKRSRIIWGFFSGLNLGFIACYLLGIGLPLLIFYPTLASGLLIVSGLFLSVIFTGLALLVSTHQQDKSRSMGIVLLIWAFFSFIFDGIQLWVIYQFAEYPIEEGILASTFLNPVSISRIIVVMQTEASALLGLSGAVFKDFFGSMVGAIISIATLVVWTVLPYIFIRKRFLSRDF